MLTKKHWCGCEDHATWEGDMQVDAYRSPCCKHSIVICKKEDCYHCIRKKEKQDNANMGERIKTIMRDMSERS